MIPKGQITEDNDHKKKENRTNNDLQNTIEQREPH